MPERLEPGHYRVGEIKQKRGGPRPRECGVFGVIKGENIEENSRPKDLDWRNQHRLYQRARRRHRRECLTHV